MPAAHGLLDHVLDAGLVDQRQHLLGRRLGRREEPGAEPGGGDDCLANTHGSTGPTRYHPAQSFRRTFRELVRSTPPLGRDTTRVTQGVEVGHGRRGSLSTLGRDAIDCYRLVSRSTPRGARDAHLRVQILDRETIEVQQAFTDDALTEAVHPASGRSTPSRRSSRPSASTSRATASTRPTAGGRRRGSSSRRVEVDRAPRPSSKSSSADQLGLVRLVGIADSSTRPGRRPPAAVRRRPAELRSPLGRHHRPPAPLALTCRPCTAAAEIGVFGGSGFYSFLDDVEVDLDTPYGAPAAPVAIGTVAGRASPSSPAMASTTSSPPHHSLPGQRPRAEEARRAPLIAPCAVGSLQPEIHPGEMVVVSTSSSTAPGAARHLPRRRDDPPRGLRRPLRRRAASLLRRRPGGRSHRPRRRHRRRDPGAPFLHPGRVELVPPDGLVRRQHDRLPRGRPGRRGRHPVRARSPSSPTTTPASTAPTPSPPRPCYARMAENVAGVRDLITPGGPPPPLTPSGSSRTRLP